MELKLHLTQSVNDVLAKYDADDLLRTIPHNYQLNQNVLNSFKNKIKPITSVDITLTEQTYNWLTALSKNNNQPISLIFN